MLINAEKNETGLVGKEIAGATCRTADGDSVYAIFRLQHLSCGVTIEKGVKVKNSIIMQKCDVQENSLLENVICDKNVVITKEKWLKGAQNYPLIVAKNVVI